jgi:hypothetical protein
MTGSAGMLRALRNRRLCVLFSIAAGLMVSLAARAADLELPTDAKILEALKAKRLTRCPRAPARPGCGGARLQNPPPISAPGGHGGSDATIKFDARRSLPARGAVLTGSTWTFP